MAVNPLDAAIPTSPLVDDEGRVTAAWRAFFRALLTRTGGNPGLATPDTAALQAAMNAETNAREAADAALNSRVTSEAAARAAADATKYDVAGGTIGGPVGFYGHGAAAKPIVTGSKSGNAALGSLLAGLAGLGLVNDAST